MTVMFFNVLFSLALGLFLTGVFGLISFFVIDEGMTENKVDFVLVAIVVAVWIGVAYGIFINL